MNLLKMTDLNLSGKYVLIREDFNVPMHHNKITSFVRIDACINSIRLALNAGAKVILCSHLGRPTEGEFDSQFSLTPVAEYLTKVLGKEVPLIKNWKNQNIEIADGNLVLLENVRFNLGESSNDDTLAKQMANLCDIFVMDAFAVAHRAQASTHGVSRYADIACAGPLLIKELESLEQALEMPNRPMISLVGGAKVSTKLEVLQSLTKICDQLIPAGGIANTFLAAKGYNIGKSLVELEQLSIAKQLQERHKILLPVDVVCSTEISSTATTRICDISSINDNEMIIDIGPKTREIISDLLNKSKTILWNGPVGIFEIEQFSYGTQAIAEAIANSNAFSIAGGGDTIAAIEKYQIENEISYISTGGGAFLEFVEGKKLPAIEILEQHKNEVKQAT